MKDILQEIIAAKRIAVEQLKRTADRSALERKIDENRSHRSMREALAASTSGIIAEFKRRSPSKGWINREADVRTVASDYQANGAAALSILTDTLFRGSAEDLIAARPQIDIPILRKDFTIDQFQLYEPGDRGRRGIADRSGATARPLPELAATAHRLGLEVLLEIHSEKELDYISDEVDMIGVNNRNLGTFDTRVGNSFRLAGQLPQDRLLVSESGISDPETVKKLREAGFRGFLIGENFMKTADPGYGLDTFIKTLNL
ncbi:MAG: indole-3-glycerol phosphate synthase TrpC [Alistipes sp.]